MDLKNFNKASKLKMGWSKHSPASSKSTSTAFADKLSPEAYNVCFLKGTEPPGSGKYLHNKEKGMYVCAVCGHNLFKSDTKYDSGTGWPSFWEKAEIGVIKEIPDNSLGMQRTEVLCANCGSHLGHVFTDGPKETTGLRYCINSLALEFKPEVNNGI